MKMIMPTTMIVMMKIYAEIFDALEYCLAVSLAFALMVVRRNVNLAAIGEDNLSIMHVHVSNLGPLRLMT